MEFHIEKIRHFSVEFLLKIKPNQTKPNLMAFHDAHVNSSESIRILEASTGSRGKPCGSKGQFRRLTFDLLRKWRENCSQSQGVSMKIKYVFF